MPLTPRQSDSHPLTFSKGILLEPISTPGSFVLQGKKQAAVQTPRHLFSSHKEKVTTTLLFTPRLKKEHAEPVHEGISNVFQKRKRKCLWGVKMNDNSLTVHSHFLVVQPSPWMS